MFRVRLIRATLALSLVAGAFSAHGVTPLTDQQRKFYETTLKVSKQEISDLQAEISQEQGKIKDQVAELQNAINASMQMYSAACTRLGVANDLTGAPKPGGPPPKLSDQQRKFYETTLQVTKQEIADLKNQIQALEASVSSRIAELQNAIQASKQMYAAACARLGIPNDLANGN